MNQIIALWTHPRSISTAFERVFIERSDFKILHEPFSYYYYVHKDEATIQQEFVDPEHPTDYLGIRDHILKTADYAPLFFKDMCSHCSDRLMHDNDLLSRMTNTFLIRDPARAIPSYYAMNNAVTSEEIGLEQLKIIFQKVMEMNETPPVVVDAADLESHPDGTMAAYCDALGIPFIQEAMTWEESHHDKWDIWKDWHKDAAQSTGIKKDMEVFEFDTENTEHLKRLYDIHYPFYETLYQYRINPINPGN